MHLININENKNYQVNFYRAVKLFSKPIIISLFIFFSIYYTGVDFIEVRHLISKLHIKTYLFIVSYFILNFYLVSFRNYLAYKQFRIPISYSALNLALINGVLGGIIPIFGSAFSQSLSLNKNHNMPASTSIILFFYDKFIMALSGLILTIVASYILLKNWSFISSIIIYNEGTSILEFSIAFISCIIVALIWILPKSDKKAIYSVFTWRTIIYFISSMLISVVVWLMSANCFLYCIMDLYGTQFNSITILGCFAACCIVSFLASMPLSVNGWGVREFAAINILSLLLIPKEIALSSSIAVGILSTLSVLLLSIIYFLKYKHV